MKELTVLLSAVTNHRFFECESGSTWVISGEGSTKSTTWSQKGYPLPDCGWPEETFSNTVIGEAPRVPYGEHYKYVPDSTSGSEFEIHFPDALDEFLDRYFVLDAGRMRAFYAACHLWAQAFDLKAIKAPSMSLVASVSAIETLVNFTDDPGPSCPTCGAPRSIERCTACQAPRYRLNSRFKEFLKGFAGAEPTFAEKLYRYRSGISHDGALLREELHDPGFTTGGNDEQMIFQNRITRVTHIALVDWLIRANG